MKGWKRRKMNRKIQVLDGIGYVELIEVHGREALLSQIAGLSHNSEKGPSVAKLLEWEHTSPLEFAGMIFKIKAPLFVNRQLFRHRTFSYLEQSGRYNKMQPEFYVPNDDAEIMATYSATYEEYLDLLKRGIPKEQARAILPLGMYSTFYVKMDLRNMLNFFELRLDSHAQKEIQEYAYAILNFAREYFPSIGEYITEKMLLD